MEKESNRREFLRKASLAGIGLVAGCCGKDKERVKELEAQIAASQEVQVDNDGNLVILDREVQKKLGEVWERQGNKPDDDHCSQVGDPPHPPPGSKCPRKGIHVKFEYSKPAEDPTRPPQDQKVNSLCSC